MPFLLRSTASDKRPNSNSANFNYLLLARIFCHRETACLHTFGKRCLVLCARLVAAQITKTLSCRWETFYEFRTNEFQWSEHLEGFLNLFLCEGVNYVVVLDIFKTH